MKLIQIFDQQVFGLINKRVGAWKGFFKLLSVLGHPWTVLSLGAAGYVAATINNQYKTQQAFLLGFIAYGLNTIMKLVLRRRRPHNLRIRTLGIRSYSFPSGHAFGSVIFYGIYIYSLQVYLHGTLKIALFAISSVLVFLIGLSRVRLQTHYPSDVLGGWILGGTALLIIIIATDI